ncbi:hypothetical protein NMY22_g10184 [Coprinellus aureogranulatus]|nr:hypothetical protein NMY22_g10184 [Coprinellus aureogranulatus]
MPTSGTPTSSKRPRWMQYGGYYRQIEDTAQPWVPSPRVSTPMPVPNAPVFDINLHYKAGEVSSLSSGSSSSTWSPIPRPPNATLVNTPATQEVSLPSGRFASLRRIAKKLTVRRTKSRRDVATEAPPAIVVEKAPVIEPPPQTTLSTRVQPHEWKEWGYYARPTINFLTVHNSSSPPQYYAPLQHIDETDLTPEDVFRSLRDPDDTPHPERWKLGISHPSLPPRPPRSTRSSNTNCSGARGCTGT